MTEREKEITARMKKRLVGRKIVDVEYHGTGIVGDGSYAVLRVEGDVDVYASNPSMYVPVEGRAERQAEVSS